MTSGEGRDYKRSFVCLHRVEMQGPAVCEGSAALNKYYYILRYSLDCPIENSVKAQCTKCYVTYWFLNQICVNILTFSMAAGTKSISK